MFALLSGVYLPSNSDSVVVEIEYNSGIPLQRCAVSGPYYQIFMQFVPSGCGVVLVFSQIFRLFFFT